MFRNWILQNFPFLEDDFDALTDYELFSKMCGYVLEYSKDNEEMKKKIEEFQTYFDNLDVQEEINNKLDEMAESGELVEIITEYINLKNLLVFNTVNDMINATNLISGSNVMTLGFYSLNDGGNALYKIREVTNDDTIDGMFIIYINENLVAELIYDKELNVKQIGCHGDNETDDSTNIQLAINKLSVTGGTLVFPKSSYLLSSPLVVPDNNELIVIEGNNSSFNVILNANSTFLTCKSTDNYIRIMINNLTIINNSSSNLEVNGIEFQKVTERTVLNNVRINKFYNNVSFKNCWNLNINKLVSINASNDGLHCEDVTNAFTFNSCIFINNEHFNILIAGRGHVFNSCDISIYKTNSQNKILGCHGVSFNGCYYEESNNPISPILIQASRGVSFNGCYFEATSNASNYKLIDVYNSYGISIISSAFRTITPQDDTGYLIYLREGSTVNLISNDFRNSNKVCFVINSQLSVDNNKLEDVTSFITQENHLYARITGNLEFSSEYENSTLPHKEIVHLTLNSVPTYGSTENRPSGYYIGQTYFNTTTNTLNVYNGIQWI